MAWGITACNEFVLQEAIETEAPPVQVTERFSQVPLPQVDILWVVDGTPSMRTAIASLQQGLIGFLDTLDGRGLSWQIGVVTTDVSGAYPGVLRGDPWILTPSTDNAEGVLITTMGDLSGREPSGGLGAAALAIGPALADGFNRGFRRPDAALHVIVVSDSDDQSEDVLGANPVAAALSVLDQESDRAGRSTRLSAVVGDRGTGCSGPDGTALPGDRYLDVAEATGGVIGSVCDTDLAPVIQAVGDISVDWAVSFPLQAVPEPGTVQVAVNGTLRSSGWQVEQLEESDTGTTARAALVFTTPPPPAATIIVRYQLGSTP
mgnify:FL=1